MMFWICGLWERRVEKSPDLRISSISLSSMISLISMLLFFPLGVLAPIADFTGSGPSSISGSYRARKARQFRPLWTAHGSLRRSPHDE